ncbi:TIGR00725 family protein [Bacteroidota bacterium]
MKNRKIQAAVIGDSTADKEKYDFAYQVGKLLAEMDITVISGGRGGVMEAVSKGAFEAGGITVGILPSSALDDANKWCTISIPTGMGHARNALTTMAADFVIAIGGGAGTLTEMGFGWIYEKPIIAVTRFGGWSEKLGGELIDNRQSIEIIQVEDVVALKRAVNIIVS